MGIPFAASFGGTPVLNFEFGALEFVWYLVLEI